MGNEYECRDLKGALLHVEDTGDGHVEVGMYIKGGRAGALTRVLDKTDVDQLIKQLQEIQGAAKTRVTYQCEEDDVSLLFELNDGRLYVDNHYSFWRLSADDARDLRDRLNRWFPKGEE